MGGMKREETELLESQAFKIFSPVEGEVIPIEETPDPVFAEKIVGDGVSIIPSGDTMFAPADGTIEKIYTTNHAFSMLTDDGIELFVHFGLDTVDLKGEGFTRVAEQGATVKKGDPVIRFDLELLSEKAKSVITPVVISNMDEFGEMTKVSGKVAVGDPILFIKKK
nr:PTS glucose transporter subunit IIA [Maridesulfovibrio ferrireducens]